ncbi:MAG: hypothetical protein WC547_08160 [Candidatus Omnitrophota bacterium]
MIAIRLLRVTIIISVVLCQSISFAQTVQERFISSTFKTLAKTYIAATDFKTLQKNTLARLAQLDNDSFHERYPRTLQLIKDSPVLEKQFGLRPDMSVGQAISFTKSLDKKKVAAIIDAVPDQVVARHVMEDLSRARRSVNSKHVADQVSGVWSNLQDRLDRTAHRSRQ